MKIAIVQFPGSNCERETMLAVQRAGMEAVEFLWNESASILAQMDGFIIVGGFSYEDRARAGIIAALDPIMNEIKKQADLGKPVLGICNGAQILVESGLVPGLKHNQLAMALTENKRIKEGKVLGTGFYNVWINLKPGRYLKANAFTRFLKEDSVLKIPTAHAQGRFVMSEALLELIEKEGLNCFQYCDEQGQIDANFPTNPNGSMGNLAAVMNKRGNVLAMMPHPERTNAGDLIFSSMREYILEGKMSHPETLAYTPPPSAIAEFKIKPQHHQLVVALIITDNEAITVQSTLERSGLGVKVQKMVHWEIECEDESVFEKIKASGLLFNDKKEYVVSPKASALYLVRAKEDLIGQQKLQQLREHFGIVGGKAIRHGILWGFESEGSKLSDLMDPIIQSNILFNPFSHEAWLYPQGDE